MAKTYGDAVRCEAVRDEVFDGKKSPMIFGQPEQWLALLIESLLRRRPRRARAVRASCGPRVRRGADIAGDIDGRPFEWIADADSRLGPVLEAIVNGRY